MISRAWTSSRGGERNLTTAQRSSGVDAGVRTSAYEPFPLTLHRQARTALREHVRRAVLRVGVLVLGDLIVVSLVTGVVEASQHHLAFSVAAAPVSRALFVQGRLVQLQLLCSIFLGLLALGNYRAGDRRRDPSSIMAGSLLGVGLILWPLLWSAPSILSFLEFGVTAAMLGIGLVLERIAVDTAVTHLRPTNVGAPRTLVIGFERDAREAMASVALRDRGEFQLIGFLDLSASPSGDAIGGVSDLVTVIDVHRIDTVVLCGRIEAASFSHLVTIADAAGCKVIALPVELLANDVEASILWHRGVPMVQLTRPGLRGQHLLMKRCLDLTGALLAVVILSPAFIAIAIAVRLTSRGPVLFRQLRVGTGGHLFSILKFRTMVADAEAQREALSEQSIYGDARLFKIKNDPRITRVGRFLRRTSLDELPQFWNVIRGDMSLVGPRPPLPAEVELYDEHHFSRFAMRPGITGPWQVSGRNEVTDFEEVIRLETAYMRRWSIWKDIEIIVQTIPAVLRMDGAH